MSRFSSTVISANSPSPCGMCTSPSPEMYSGVRPATGSPPSSTSPPEGFSRPLTARRKVVFPCPFGPMMTATSPGSTVIPSPRMTGASP